MRIRITSTVVFDMRFVRYVGWRFRTFKNLVVFDMRFVRYVGWRFPTFKNLKRRKTNSYSCALTCCFVCCVYRRLECLQTSICMQRNKERKLQCQHTMTGNVYIHTYIHIYMYIYIHTYTHLYSFIYT